MVSQEFDRITIQEEEPVTLQIAAICNTGWALASDRMERLDDRTGTLTDKIFTDADAGVTYATCGNSAVAKLTGYAMLAALKNKSLPGPRFMRERRLCEIANDAWQQAFDTTTIRPPDADRSEQGLTIFFHDDPTIGWALFIGKNWSVAESILDKRTRADRTNPAVFFFEKYYRAELSPLPLGYLAAHTICIAPFFNKTGIGGLDVTVCEQQPDGTYAISPLSRSQLRELVNQSVELDNYLWEHFGSNE